MCSDASATTLHGVSKRQKTGRLVALIVCAFFFICTFLSFAYILIHADHVHDHDGPDGGCATCIHITAAKNLLKTVGAAVSAAAVSLGNAFVVVSALRLIGFYVDCRSLFALKVRLNS
ncbi:MAG: hypothetical protein AAGU74_09820 [Bacillota bacterium]